MNISYKNYVSEALVLTRYYNRIKRIIEKPRKINVFWASQAIADKVNDNKIIEPMGGCGRKMYYQMFNEIPEITGYASIKRMDTGSLCEKEEIKVSTLVFDEVYNDIVVNIPLGDVEYHGRIDHIVKDRITGKYIILEHKSAYKWGFTKIEKSCDYNISYAFQLGLYMYAIRTLNQLAPIGIDNNNVDTGIMLYTNRGSGDIADDINVDIDRVNTELKPGNNIIKVTTTCKGVENLVDIYAIMEKSNKIYQYAAEHKLPPRDLAPSTDIEILDDLVHRKMIRPQDRTLYLQNKKKLPWQCSYCDYKHKCIEDENANTLEENQEKAKEIIKTLQVKYRDLYGIEIEDVYSGREEIINKELPSSYRDI